MNKPLIFIEIIILIVVFILIFRVGFDFQGEDSWIKDSRGVYVKHGNPYSTPEYVLEQQQIINKAKSLYDSEKSKGTEFSSQCLGIVEIDNVDDKGNELSYAVDIVHVPRTSEDNQVENQCEDYRNGNVKYFIELDKEIA